VTRGSGQSDGLVGSSCRFVQQCSTSGLQLLVHLSGMPPAWERGSFPDESGGAAGPCKKSRHVLDQTFHGWKPCARPHGISRLGMLLRYNAYETLPKLVSVQVKLRRQQRLFPCTAAPAPSGGELAALEKAHKNRMADFMQRHCRRLLQAMMDRPFGHVFNAPVDTEKYPNYLSVVTTPMDFGTIRKRLDANTYTNLDAFVSDVNLVFSNARQFNAPHSLVHHMADALQVLCPCTLCLACPTCAASCDSAQLSLRKYVIKFRSVAIRVGCLSDWRRCAKRCPTVNEVWGYYYRRYFEGAGYPGVLS
jgi:hypothetical protein